MSRVFISCGQRTEQERALGAAIAELVNELTPYDPYFAEEQSSLTGLTEHILTALHDSIGIIAVLHHRGEVTAGDERSVRASVWVEQEIAVAAFINQVLERPIQIVAFQQRGLALEGMRAQLLLNPVEFGDNNEVLAHLRKVLSTWVPADDTTPPQLSLSIQYLERSIESERHEYMLVVTLTNDSDEVIAPSHADLEIPARVLFDNPPFERVPERDTDRCSFFRNTAVGQVFPGDSCRLFQVMYFMDHDIFWHPEGLFELPVRVTLYGVSDEPIVVQRPFGELQVF